MFREMADYMRKVGVAARLQPRLLRVVCGVLCFVGREWKAPPASGQPQVTSYEIWCSLCCLVRLLRAVPSVPAAKGPTKAMCP